MRRLLQGILRGTTGMGMSGRQRLLRLCSSLSVLIGAVLIGVAAVAATGGHGGPPKRKALPAGTVFSVSVSSLQAASGTGATAGATSTLTPSPSPGSAAQPTVSGTPQSETSPAAGSTPPDDSPVTKIEIPAIKVSAPISYKGVDANGVLEAPDGSRDVAYYSFSGHPGAGSGANAVFSGHVDFFPHQTAVFWDLHSVKPGDHVDVELQDGARFDYLITTMIVYPSTTLPIDFVLGETPEESVTLITCDGDFVNGEYTNRLVVRAVRQPSPAATAQSGGN